MQVHFTHKINPQFPIVLFFEPDTGAILGQTHLSAQQKEAAQSIIASVGPKLDAENYFLVPKLTPNDLLFLLVPFNNGHKKNAKDLEIFFGKLGNLLKATSYETATIILNDFDENNQALAKYSILLSSYGFKKYKTKSLTLEKLNSLELYVSDFDAATKAYDHYSYLVDALEFTRDLVSEPGNILNPETYVERIKALSELGLTIKILDEKDMQALNMNALLGVGVGSAVQSYLVILEWMGADASEAPVSFVGKGVTFDTGGISIKPAENMEEMKWDMGGSAAVVGAMIALARRHAKLNAVGIIGLVENMPDGAAQRPGDVVKTADGLTVEVINTDAEGRLVLADALWYCQNFYKPKIIIDLATLTGAMVVALGTDIAGMFCNNDDLADKLLKAAEVSGDNLWRMPLASQYEKQIDSKIADIKNIGGRWGGSITAALFLQRFIHNNIPWAHLDIAPTAWTNEMRIPTNPVGATGYGVRLLDCLVRAHYEH